MDHFSSLPISLPKTSMTEQFFRFVLLRGSRAKFNILFTRWFLYLKSFVGNGCEPVQIEIIQWHRIQVCKFSHYQGERFFSYSLDICY